MKGFCFFMSYPITTLQQILKTCLKLLYGLILAVLVFAFMMLPETLISETIASEGLAYHPVNSHQEISGISRLIENAESTCNRSPASNNAAADWHFHLKFPLLGSALQNDIGKPPAQADPRLHMVLRKLANETSLLPAAMQ